MYDYRVPRQNAKAKLLALLFLMLTVASFAGSAFTPYPAILQCVGLACLFPMIQIVARYMVVQYLYRLRPYEDGNVDFEVYAYRGGARMQLVCRVGLEEIVAIAPLCAENKKAPKGIKRYGYQMDIAPKGAVVVSITNGDGDCELLLVPDTYIEETLREAAKRYAVPTDRQEMSAQQEEISDK